MNEPLPKDSPTAFALKVLGVTPHARQSELLECRVPIKVAACGRRFGKTMAAAIDALHFAMTKPRTTQLVIAPTHDQSKILHDLAVHLAQNSLLAGVIARTVDSPFPELILVTRDADGHEAESTIMARSVSHDARNIRGHGADRVIVDEAAFVGETILTQVVPPILAASRYRELVLLSTPFGTHGAFHAYFERGMAGDPDVRAFHFPTSANPHVPAEYLERQRREMTALAFATEYLAEFCEDVGAVFRYDVIQAAISSDLIPGAVDGHHYVIGYDPARYSDRSGVAVLDCTELPYRCVQVLDLSGRDYLHQAATIRQLADAYNRAKVLVDATSHDQMVSQLKRDGVRAEPYRFTAESKRELIDGLVIALEHGDLVLPNHPDLIRELSYYRFETTAAGNVKLGAPEGAGHFDDLVTALSLGVFGARKKRGGGVKMLDLSGGGKHHRGDRDVYEVMGLTSPWNR
jgi:Terminase large subunit, T4likevirus-type, N-terminal/Terminase RNaseH-like domain